MASLLRLKYNELELIKAKMNSREALADMLGRIGNGGLTFIGKNKSWATIQ